MGINSIQLIQKEHKIPKYDPNEERSAKFIKKL